MSNEMQLSENAKAALLAAPSWDQGATVPADIHVFPELLGAALVGVKCGLTRKGSIAAQQLKQARERELFGA